jgi:hypothetical protein
MKSGGGKRKGGARERDVCKVLSLWITKGKKDTVFWRSAISGGRATVAKKAGYINPAQAGDICAVEPEGFPFAAHFFVEVKHYKDLGLGRFLLGLSSTLGDFWKKATEEATSYNKRAIIIARQNRLPDFVLFDPYIAINPPLKWTKPNIANHLVTFETSQDDAIMLMRLEDFLNQFEFDNANS